MSQPNDDDLDPQQITQQAGYEEPDEDPTPDEVRPGDPDWVEPADLPEEEL
jgi:hypothetical protein